ncbi:MAG: hypothetical protein FJZ01_03750 [Candidatus Sericytochromatia bacterium]|nr:hypothetical protein [Candidatus Tanganyikabacteria bacterium]
MTPSLAQTVCATILPGWQGRVPPGFFPAHVRLALLGSAWVFQFAALARSGKSFRRLDPAARQDLIERLAASRLAALRGLVQWWKLVALVSAEEP